MGKLMRADGDNRRLHMYGRGKPLPTYANVQKSRLIAIPEHVSPQRTQFFVGAIVLALCRWVTDQRSPARGG